MKQEHYPIKKNSRSHFMLYAVALFQTVKKKGCTTLEVYEHAPFDSKPIVATKLMELRNKGFLEGSPTDEANNAYINTITDDGIEVLRGLGDPERKPDGSFWSPDRKIEEIIGNGQEVFENERELVDMQPKRDTGEEETTGVEECITRSPKKVEDDSVAFGLPSQEELIERFEERGLGLYTDAIENGDLSVAELYNLAENL